jgi:endoglucanase
MRTRVRHPLFLLIALVAAMLAAPSTSTASAAGTTSLGQPEHLHTTVVGGRKAIRVTWSPPTTGVPVGLVYEVLLDGDVVDTVTALQPLESTIAGAGLTVGHTYRVGVRSVLGPAQSATASTTQQLYIAPVTTVQARNRSNPLAGHEWGVYRGIHDPAMLVWRKLGQDDQDKFAPIVMMQKSKFFGRKISDADAYAETKDYIETTQDGDPDRQTVMTLFRMFPWEGEASILDRLPTKAEQAGYKRFVNGVARAIGDNRVAVVVQPDGFIAWRAYTVLKPKLGARRALLPARMLAWTARTLSKAGPHVSIYMDMGSEDWARGRVAPVAKFLKLSGVKYARGFSLNVSHKNYLDREILFARKVSRALARKGLPGKHAVLDTSDNGHPFAGKEINPLGSQQPDYTPPGEIGPCRKKHQRKPCTALGVPPTTDVDNPQWGLKPSVGKVAARYVDAYLWVSRPWLPDQGRGGTQFSPRYASLLLKTWPFSPYFTS